MGKGRGRGRGRARGRAEKAQKEETRPGGVERQQNEQRPAEVGLNQNQFCDPVVEVAAQIETNGHVPSKEASQTNGQDCVVKRPRVAVENDENDNVMETNLQAQPAEKQERTATPVTSRPKTEDIKPVLVDIPSAAKSPSVHCAAKVPINEAELKKVEKVSENGTIQLAKSMEAMSLNRVGASSETSRLRNGGVNTQLLKRPGIGKAGRPIRLKANFVRLQLPNDGDIYHYDVVIMPDKCPRGVNQEVVAKMVQEYQKIFKAEKPVFDGKKNLYSKRPLPIGNVTQNFIVKIPSDRKEGFREFEVTIKQVARVSLHTLDEGLKGRTEIPKDTIQALEVVLRMAPSARYIPVGRSFFSEPAPGTAIDLGNGCEMWYGSYQSIRPTQWGMLVNIDHATTAFYKSQWVLDYLVECNPRVDLRNELRDSERKQFEKKIKGLKVEYTYISGQHRQKRIIGISKESARQIKFEVDGDGGSKRQTNVAQYFQEKYNIRLKFPNLQCLTAGSEKNVVHFPMELCKLVPGQRVMKKLDENQTSKMIRETAKDAMDRKRKIENKVAEANFDEDPFLKDFDMRINKELVSIRGRVLQPPAIQLDRSQVTPRDGKWDMRSSAFLQGMKTEKWAVLICANERFCNQDQVKSFCSELCSTSSALNMPINGDPSYVKYLGRSNNITGLQNAFDEIVRNVPGLQLVLVILDGGLYAEVKSLADTYFGILTQCVLVKNVKRFNKQLLANLCMKINAKVSGVNGSFANNPVSRPRKVFEKPVIFLGADVTHPSPGDTKKPSIAAVVGSIDAYPMKYAARVRAQGHRKEIIADLTSMTKELLKEFYKATGHQPAKIIMYRDGVSEGQFSQVLHFELEAVRNACRELSKAYRPSITFITVQKRHHVRLFAEDANDQVGKSRNIPAGTVVDQAICHPSEFDFYLCSHNGIQGTSRPSHYRVLYDDSKFTADELQQLTYALCHNYARCTRSVSIPPPAYYAHHVAMRANYHIQATDSSSTGSSSESQTGSASSLDALNKSLEQAIKIHEKLLSRMYFI